MASLVVQRGRLRAGQQMYQSTNYGATRHVQVMSVDIGATVFATGHTKLNDSADVTESAASYFDKAFDGVPTESVATITSVCTLATGEGNIVIKRIAQHDNTAANVSASSVSLVAGIDGQTLGKTADFSLSLTLSMAFTSV